ncbi:MAG: glycosyltransferase family 9 protein [Candidatus Pacebacteria bacterium]|nr:glycosyltransferase family 9 protein [Candidatus Paceibacterota bacterium]
MPGNDNIRGIDAVKLGWAYVRSLVLPVGPRFLLVSPWGLGNSVLASPVLAELGRLYPEVERVLVGPVANVALLDVPGLVDVAIPVEEPGVTLLRQGLHGHRQLLRYHNVAMNAFSTYDMGLSTLRRLRLVGKTASIQFSPEHSPAADCVIDFLPERHEAQYNLEAVRCLGYDVDIKAMPELFIQPEEESWACGWLAERGLTPHKFALIHPGWVPEKALKSLPAALVRDLAGGLQERFPDNVALLLGASEQAMADVLVRESKVEAVRLEGIPDVRKLAAVLSCATIVVSADTGPMHIAAAGGSRVVGCFGPTSVTRSRPLGPSDRVAVVTHPDYADCANCCNRWNAKSCFWGRPCLRTLPVEGVLEKVAGLLDA